MMTTTTTIGTAHWTATLDHRTGATTVGGPASRYHRVARCDGRHSDCTGVRVGVRPNYAARRLGALVLALSAVMAGTWLVGEVAEGIAGQPASAAGGTEPTDAFSSGDPSVAGPEVHVARSGDTLWSIADSHRGEMGRDRYVDALVALNDGTAIRVGQAVHLP